jgi:hypothetical protein
LKRESLSDKVGIEDRLADSLRMTMLVAWSVRRFKERSSTDGGRGMRKVLRRRVQQKDVGKFKNPPSGNPRPENLGPFLSFSPCHPPGEAKGLRSTRSLWYCKITVAAEGTY